MIVIAGIPFIVTNRAMAAPAVLKASLSQHGFISKALDLNYEVLTKVNASDRKTMLYRAFLDNVFCDEIVADYSRLVKYCAKRILDQNPTLIGLSLFCNSCRNFCEWLCAELRQHTNTPILIGGPGIRSVVWVDKMKSLDLIDDFISGDGELSIVEYAKGNKNFIGTNSHKWDMIPDLTNLPIPDFDDYDLCFYNEPAIPVVDSRGCVQSCEFCDVIEFWKKFQFKTADKIFEEILAQINKYNIYHVEFRSSISNGNFKEFSKLMTLISEYNENKFRSEQISWEGSYIIRSSRNEKIWEAMSKTNPSLFMGVESLSERTRISIGKNFTNDDLHWTLEQIKKYNINSKLLLIVGYPTETEDDWEITKKWFIDHHEFASCIRSVQFADPMIIPGTELDRKKEEYGIELSGNAPVIWVNNKSKISIEQRNNYKADLIKLVNSLGYKIEFVG